ncbi:YaiI/YqxD family protein [Bacillus lacus]|uniref:UPF0178 protein GJU40_03800 n=1 Tax=Metabacillus lacus TaxID=1983721 RepID=A0A7X2IWY5_9BACI|nr:YaiI/YqxD family protein [Metabacillus lacus]MRX71295.1 YaiI/YqxD family protein [Metabacillus lacus]
MKIFVDADACPVKEEILQAAGEHHLPVIFVASYNHLANPSLGGEWVYVDTGREAADLYIANHTSSGDLVVTQDIGLAGLLLRKNVTIITPRGKQYTESNIDSALQYRYLAAKERSLGNHSKGPKKLTDKDKMNFITVLKKILSNYEGFPL